MTQCPKCGSRKIVGPKYHKETVWHRECLGYTCFQCGYSMTTPTKDHATPKKAD
jgi:hypothetical protein